MLVCPALTEPRSQLFRALQGALAKWKLPFHQLQTDFKGRTCNHWKNASLEAFRMSGISRERLTLLAEDFWNTHCHKSCIPYSRFIPSVQKALLAHQQSTITAIPEDLMTILVEHFSLSVEAQTSSLTHSPLLPEWCSDSKEDLLFGSAGDFLSTSLAGKNLLFVCLQHDSDGKVFKDKMDKIKKLLLSKLPTRILLISPPRLLSVLEGREVLELAQVPHSFPFRSQLDAPSFATTPVSVILLINKESMWMDPINWSAFKEDLRDWSDKNCPNLSITQVIDTRFCERLSPSHSPRSCATGKVYVPNIYHFASPTPNHHENVNEMLIKGVPLHIANQISKVNKHHPLLAVLGILPNQLRDLLKTATSTCDEAFEDVSFTLFLHGYRIWKLRRSKVNRYWKEIARDEWKPHSAKKSSNKHHLEEEKCRNPFHFLSRH
jgi:hypothetical protein